MPPSRSNPGRKSGSASARPGEIYVEFQQIGNAVRVAAVDAVTGDEVVIMGPKNAPQRELERVAVQKLRAQMAKAQAARKSSRGHLA